MPTEALMVDDVGANVDAAVALGMAGHVYEGSPGLEDFLRCQRLIPSGPGDHLLIPGVPG